MYKRLLIVALTLLSTSYVMAQHKNKGASQSQEITEWKDVNVFEQNKIYPRANVIPYSNENTIEKWKYEESAYYVSLNGTWKFDLHADISGRPNPESTTFSTSDWNTCKVPASQWIRSGKQVRTPILKNALDIPSNGNVVATYSRVFDAPKSWGNYKAFLQLQARSAYYVWVNKEYVGYSEDSRSISEFDITKHLKYGKSNTITVQVIGTSTGTLLEMEQDRAFLGITGDVAIVLKPQTNVQDYTIQTDFEVQNGFGAFVFNATIENPAKKGQYYVEVELWNPKGKELDKMGKWIVFDKKSTAQVRLERSFGVVQPWSAETPNLYTAVVRLRNEKMEVVETVGTRFAFRRVELKDGQLLVNSTAIKLRGVVYTGYDAENNGLLGVDRMKADLKLMKQNNVNAIRTAVYSPANPRLYELCDEYGIYVVCDANIQPFSTQSKAVATDKDMVNHFIVRVQNMYERYKNHPSIIAWSLGSSVDNGVCMDNAYRVLKQKDKERPVIFSGASYSENTDIIASRNMDIDDLKAFAVKQQSRPLVLYSYGSALGNNFGGMEAVWSTVRKYNRLQGGFVSDWNSSNYFDVTRNADASVSGFITVNHQPIPYLSELRSIYRPFDVRMVTLVPDHAEFTVTNYLDFLRLNDYILEYNIYSNLKPRIIEGEVDVDLNPGESKNFKLKVPKLMLYSGEELFIRFTIRQRYDSPAVPKNTELGTFEFPLPMQWVKKQPLPDYGREELYMAFDTVDSDNRVHIFNNNIDMWFDMGQADIVSYRVNDKELLAEAPRLNFWRPATDNDLVDKNGVRLWQNLAPDNMQRQVLDANCRQIDKYTVSIDAMLRYVDRNGNTLFDAKQSYAVLYTGDVLVNNRIVASDQVKSLPCVGYQFKVGKRFDNVQWLGLDKETYPDRKQSGLMGTYRQKADDLFFKYDRPQAAGNRTDVHWVSVSDATDGLFIDLLDSTFNFSIYPYTDKQLSTTSDIYELKEQPYRVLNIDFKHAGVGSATAGIQLADAGVISAREFSFRLHLHAYSLTEADPLDFRRVRYPEIPSSVLPMPLISQSKERFDAPMKVTLTSEVAGAEIRYTLDGSVPNEKSALYKVPFTISTSTIVNAKAFKKGATASFMASRRFSYDYITSATFENKPNTPYNYNQETILFDAVRGEITDLSQGWLGFSGNDMSVVLQLSKPIDLQDVELHFAHVPDAWAFAPTQVMVYVSEDGENFSQAIPAKIKYNPGEKDMDMPQLQTVRIDVDRPNVRYVRVVAKNLGRIPVWHKAKGLRPWIMVDEIQLNEVIK